MCNKPEIWKILPKKIADCIDRLGSGEFYSRFFQMMKTLARIDQYMVFEFSPNGDYATCRLAHNTEDPDLGLQLASLYLEGAYLDDPMLKELKESMFTHDNTAPYFLQEKRELPAIYRRRFFNVPNLETKFSFVVLDRESKHLFYINFYSKKGHAFEVEQVDALQSVLPTIGSLLLKHFRDERKRRGAVQSLLASGLSEREAQICNMMLQGHTAKSIANAIELSDSTVVTYKKRAFKKLKITRKSELVRFL